MCLQTLKKIPEKTLNTVEEEEEEEEEESAMLGVFPNPTTSLKGCSREPRN